MSLMKSAFDNHNGNTVIIKNNRAEAEIFATGAGVHHYCFKKQNGVFFKPLAEADWQENLRIEQRTDLPLHLQLLGGEWPCVPFGTTKYDPDHHGFCSNNKWQIEDVSEDEIHLSIDYPEGHDVKQIKRRISLTEEGALDISLSIETATHCQLPIGLHPIFKIPIQTGKFKVTPPKFAKCATAPRGIALSASQLDYGLEIKADSDIWNALNIYGEELIQAWETDGTLKLHYPYDECDVTLNWNQDDLPHCLIWIANPGLSSLNIGNGFTGIGIEPVSSFFDQNDRANEFVELHGLSADRFGTPLQANKIWTTQYQISCTEH